MNSIVITGVSTGIGYAIAQVFVQRGFTVFGSVRSMSDAQRLAKDFGERFVPLSFDVADEAAIGAAAAEVKERLGAGALTALINNAGILVGGPLLEVSSDAFRRQLEVNVLGTFMVTKAFVPLLAIGAGRQARPGRIVNIGSIAGRLAVPFMGPYSASKAALDGFNDTLRRELRAQGIEVVLVAPGPVSTPIMAKIGQSVQREVSSYSAALRQYVRMSHDTVASAMPPEKIAQIVWEIVHVRRPKTRYEVVPSGLANFFLFSVLPRLPARVVDSLLGRMLKLGG